MQLVGVDAILTFVDPNTNKKVVTEGFTKFIGEHKLLISTYCLPSVGSEVVIELLEDEKVKSSFTGTVTRLDRNPSEPTVSVAIKENIFQKVGNFLREVQDRMKESYRRDFCEDWS